MICKIAAAAVDLLQFICFRLGAEPFIARRFAEKSEMRLLTAAPGRGILAFVQTEREHAFDERQFVLAVFENTLGIADLQFFDVVHAVIGKAEFGEYHFLSLVPVFDHDIIDILLRL